jgi:bidirectional [NiFe] hydrogenase diaphorase subunit
MRFLLGCLPHRGGDEGITVSKTNLNIDGFPVIADEGTTLLEAARAYGIHIPTLCFMDGLTPYGGCRMCIVEVSRNGGTSQIVASCTYEVQEGLNVQTNTPRIKRNRLMLGELLVASAPNVKLAQDIAARLGIHSVRFKFEDSRCILCGLCVRMCEEQMNGRSLTFAGSGVNRRIAMPFERQSETCKQCGGCDLVCPATHVPCQGVKPEGYLCGGCAMPVERKYCCSTGSPGCFCEGNPL